MNRTSQKIGYILLLVLLLAGMFSFVEVNHVQMNCDPSSPYSTCPLMQWGMALHNLDAYKSSMQATLSFATEILVSLTLLAFIAIVVSIKNLLPDRDLIFARLRLRDVAE